MMTKSSNMPKTTIAVPVMPARIASVHPISTMTRTSAPFRRPHAQVLPFY